MHIPEGGFQEHYIFNSPRKEKKQKQKFKSQSADSSFNVKKKKNQLYLFHLKKKRILCFEGRIIYFLQFQIKNNFLLLLNGFP